MKIAYGLASNNRPIQISSTQFRFVDDWKEATLLNEENAIHHQNVFNAQFPQLNIQMVKLYVKTVIIEESELHDTAIEELD